MTARGHISGLGGYALLDFGERIWRISTAGEPDLCTPSELRHFLRVYPDVVSIDADASSVPELQRRLSAAIDRDRIVRLTLAALDLGHSEPLRLRAAALVERRLVDDERHRFLFRRLCTLELPREAVEEASRSFEVHPQLGRLWGVLQRLKDRRKLARAYRVSLAEAVRSLSLAEQEETLNYVQERDLLGALVDRDHEPSRREGLDDLLEGAPASSRAALSSWLESALRPRARAPERSREERVLSWGVVHTDQPGETLRMHRSPGGIELWSISDSKRLWSMWHSRYLLSLATGPADLEIEWSYLRRPYILRPDAVQVIEPHTVHRTRQVSHPASYFQIWLDPETFERIAQRHGWAQHDRLPFGQVSDPILVQAIGSLSRRIETLTPLELEVRLEQIVGRLVQLGAGAGSEVPAPRLHPGVRRAMTAMQEVAQSTRETPSLKALAAFSGLSAPRFSHAFKQWTGLSPHAYLNLCRLSAAERLLAQGATTTEVAKGLGFTHSTHLAKRFVRSFGVLPSKWRRSFQIANETRRPDRGSEPTLAHAKDSASARGTGRA